MLHADWALEFVKKITLSARFWVASHAGAMLVPCATWSHGPCSICFPTNFAPEYRVSCPAPYTKQLYRLLQLNAVFRKFPSLLAEGAHALLKKYDRGIRLCVNGSTCIK